MRPGEAIMDNGERAIRASNLLVHFNLDFVERSEKAKCLELTLLALRQGRRKGARLPRNIKHISVALRIFFLALFFVLSMDFKMFNRPWLNHQ